MHRYMSLKTRGHTTLVLCRVVRFPLMASAGSPAAAQALRNALGAEDTSLNAGAALLLRAVDRFHLAHSRYPGHQDGCVSRKPAFFQLPRCLTPG